MATCAICESPIQRGANVRVLDTEVVHASCLNTGAQTVGAQMRSRLATERSARTQEQERSRRVLVELRSAIDQRDAEIASVTRQRDRERAGREEALADAAAARDEAERLRAQVAQLRAPARPVALAAPVAATPEPPPPAVAVDDAEVRFSLLELA